MGAVTHLTSLIVNSTFLHAILPVEESPLEAYISQFYFLFFFSSRRRHTRFDCDWSSDVCSSDLPGAGVEIIGVGRYEPTDEPDTVEVAFVVQDGWQNRGLGTILVREVLDAAAARDRKSVV